MIPTTKSHSSERSLNEWLSYLESLHHSEIDMGLVRISKVAKKLAINFDFAKVITVAGTNGKGTTCAFLEKYLLAEKHSVAVYSSPHIDVFNERLRINNINVDDVPLIAAFEKIEEVRGDISLTYYEYTTLAAFIVLQEVKPEFIILEVGLGGRLDATNIIDSDIAVLTTVDLDHQVFLGDTREEIGFEKAGIFRSNKPAVIGDLTPPLSVLSHAKDIHSQLVIRERDFKVSIADGHWQWTNDKVIYSQLPMPSIPIDNVATALSVLSLLEISVSQPCIVETITKTKVAGRTELFRDKCDVVLDVGHNPLAARYLANYVKSKSYKNVLAVVGMLSDKDIHNTLVPLLSEVSNWYCAGLDVPRGATANQLAEKLTKLNTRANCFENVEVAYKMANNEANKDDLILVFGSFYTVAAVRKNLV